MPLFQRLRRLAFGISPRETSFSRRGFAPANPAIQQHLETAGRAFVDGYNAALVTPRADELTTRLDEMKSMYSGFAYEGAAMALVLLDSISPWHRHRFQQLIDSPAGNAHWYMTHIGAGWAFARLPWARRNFERAMRRFHPLYGWLLLDGYGFHEGFFHTRMYVDEHRGPPRLSPHAARVFDQGLGRSMWFSHGADIDRISRAIEAFPAERRVDLWSGTALAASYAGGVERERLEALRDRAAAHAPQLAQAAAFAAKARQRAENPAAHTEWACATFCGMSADRAAAVTDECLIDLPPDAEEPNYQVWRARISARFSLAEAGFHTTMAGSPGV